MLATSHFNIARGSAEQMLSSVGPTSSSMNNEGILLLIGLIIPVLFSSQNSPEERRAF